MKKLLFTLLFLGVASGCAGILVEHETKRKAPDMNATYLVFPFRDPFYKKITFPGVGTRFTRSFVSHCSSYGLRIKSVFNEAFSAAEDLDVASALTYAQEAGADYIVTGMVTRWADSARDSAGLEIFVRKVPTGDVVFTTEIVQRNTFLMPGGPDEFVSSLSRALSREWLGLERYERK